MGVLSIVKLIGLVQWPAKARCLRTCAWRVGLVGVLAAVPIVFALAITKAACAMVSRDHASVGLHLIVTRSGQTVTFAADRGEPLLPDRVRAYAVVTRDELARCGVVLAKEWRIDMTPFTADHRWPWPELLSQTYDKSADFVRRHLSGEWSQLPSKAASGGATTYETRGVIAIVARCGIGYVGPVGISAIAGLVVVTVVVRWRRHDADGACKLCDYPIVVGSERCPECGTVYLNEQAE